MVVSHRAVAEFLAATDSLRDSEKAKRFTDRALDAKLKKTGAHFVTRPYRHQKICFLLGRERGSYLFLLGMGSGKTKITLDLIRDAIANRDACRALVLVPGVTNIEAWHDEGKFHAPDLSLVGITMSGEDARMQAALNAGQIVVMTYQGFAALVSDTRKKNGKNRWVPNDRKLKSIGKTFDVLVLDECSWIKNHASLVFRLVRKIRKFIRRCYGLTGTPFDKNPLDLWSQFYAIDKGDALGSTLGLYRDAFFTSEKLYWGGTDYRFKRRMKKKLARRMRHSSIRFREEDCQDLPEAVGGIDGESWMIRPVVMPRETWTYYERLLGELEESRGNYSLLENVYTRMRMMASGYLAVKDVDGENDERVEIVFKKNPKLDALVELIREIPEDEKIVVINVYQKSSELIRARLEREKISHVRIYGPTRDKIGALREFKETDARVLIGSQAIAYGLNLQRASRYMVFFESPDSAIVRKQTERRIRRSGAKGSHCYYYDLAVRGSVEMRILKAIRDGKTLLDLLMDNRVSAGDLMLTYR